jgi:hypothetical protein
VGSACRRPFFRVKSREFKSENAIKIQVEMGAQLLAKRKCGWDLLQRIRQDSDRSMV